MSFDYVRKVVSGGKARFVDQETAVDLDLVYVTDRIIIMGYPATGFAGLYRNRRRDVLKFINSRHGEKWWIWNLCPLYENAYSPESMGCRVSRYPFPDHHPPPLPLLPLAVREMTAWLDGDHERVAIIHCKAGKEGRSGTLLCSYLLSLPDLPPSPQMDRSYSYHDLARKAEGKGEKKLPPGLGSKEDPSRDGWVMVGQGKDIAGVHVSQDEEEVEKVQLDKVDGSPYGDPSSSTGTSNTTVSRPTLPPSVNIRVFSAPPYEPIAIGDEGVLDDVGQQDRKDGKVDEVFRLHSSRRMKTTSTGRGVSIPSQRRWCRYIHLVFTLRAPPSYLSPKPLRIRLASITILLHPPTTWQKPITSLIVGPGGGEGRAWASIARYDDDYVDELGSLGEAGQGVARNVVLRGVGGDGKHDTTKMFRTCGKMVAAELSSEDRASLPLDAKGYNVHHLVPQPADGSTHLILDRSREFRIKFHLASVPLGWAWLVPGFHLPEPLSSSKRMHTLHFPRSQIDFAIGPGAAIREILIRLEEVAEDESSDTARLLSLEEERKKGMEDKRGEDSVREYEE